MAKKIFASLNLDALADKMQEQINLRWKQAKSPFGSPLVIFSDNKMEQWFKLRWLKENAGTDAVILNLRTAGVENFLFEIASPKESGSKYKRLAPEILRDVVVQKLGSKNDDGKFYAETLGSKEVERYLLDGEGKNKSVNQIRLYDFSKEFSALLIDYEVTRAEESKRDEFWTAQPWQKKIYDDIFGKGGELERIFTEREKYVTICRLAQKNAEMNGGKISFNWNPARPVFIFGFCGMGQHYRTLLNEFSKTNDLYVFLQTPPNEAQDENPFVKEWVEFGRANLNLWKDQKDGAAQACDEKSFVSKKFKSDLKSYGFLSFTSAPSRLREVESLHSKICALLKDGARLGDILVVAPAIQEYKVAIEQVFDQSNPIEDDFPFVPYVFADSSSKSSLSSQALGVMFGILQKGYLSRSDLFLLLRNKLVQAARKIDDNEVSAWSRWANGLNVYRDRNGVKDWEKAKARLLLSRLSDDVVVSGGESFLPYQTIESADDISLRDFVQAVDELKEWLEFAGGDGYFSMEQIEKAKSFFEKWILPDDKAAQEDPDLLSEKYVFASVVSEIECQKTVAGSDGKIHRDILAFSIFDSIAASEFSRGTILSNGVTFSDFKPNRILSAKYVFFMGCDSKSLPGLDRSSVLDLRERSVQKGDDSIPSRYKNAFLCQLAAARDGFYVSYVNKNLKKDEDFYRSSLADLLLQGGAELELGIDEDRPWSELWTKRAFRNKRTFEALEKGAEKKLENKTRQDSSQKESGALEQEIKNFPDRVSVYKIKSFLQDPFVFMAEDLFWAQEDDIDSELQEFEPLDFDAKTASNLRKKIVMENKQDDFYSDLINQNILPDGFFGEQAFKKIKSDGEKIKEAISQSEILSLAKDKFVYDASANLLVKQKINGKEKDWILTGSLAWHNSDYEKSKTVVTLELNNSNNCLGGYVSALALIAGLGQDADSEYAISMHVIECKDEKAKLNDVINISGVTKSGALITLRKIYSAMYVERYKKCVPYALLMEKNFKPEKFYDYAKKFGGENGNPWKFFSKANLFDLWTDCGFSIEGFKAQWNEAVSHQAELIKYIGQCNTAEA